MPGACRGHAGPCAGAKLRWRSVRGSGSQEERSCGPKFLESWAGLCRSLSCLCKRPEVLLRRAVEERMPFVAEQILKAHGSALKSKKGFKGSLCWGGSLRAADLRLSGGCLAQSRSETPRAPCSGCTEATALEGLDQEAARKVADPTSCDCCVTRSRGSLPVPGPRTASKAHAAGAWPGT